MLFRILCESFLQVILMAANCPVILQLGFEQHWSCTLYDTIRHSVQVFDIHFLTIRELTYSMLVIVELLSSL